MTATAPTETDIALKKWKGKRGALIMALHEVQNQRGFVPREAALQLAHGMDIPVARIYEVLTFYNYFKLSAPGKVVLSICTGTACHLKGAPELIEAFRDELGIDEGETTPNGVFHLQCVRCVGCCGLAPVVVANGKTYGKLKPSDVPALVSEWRARIASEDEGAADAEG